MSFGIEGLHMCITEHYLLQSKVVEGFPEFQAIWREEQLEAAKEAVKNAEVVMTTLNGLPGS